MQCHSLFTSGSYLNRQSENGTGHHHLRFGSLPPASASPIVLTEALPSLDDGGTTIDGSGSGALIDGRNLAGEDVHGLFITSSNNTVRMVSLRDIPGVAVLIGAFDGKEVHDNRVESVSVIHSGYGGPSQTGRMDSMWIMAYCDTCRAYGNHIVNCRVENGADDGIEVWSQNANYRYGLP